jgi:hypothetical protein
MTVPVCPNGSSSRPNVSSNIIAVAVYHAQTDAMMNSQPPTTVSAPRPSGSAIAVIVDPAASVPNTATSRVSARDVSHRRLIVVSFPLGILKPAGHRPGASEHRSARPAAAPRGKDRP